MYLAKFVFKEIGQHLRFPASTEALSSPCFFDMFDTVALKRELELLSDRLGKAQEYL